MWSGHHKDGLQEGYWQSFYRDGTVNIAEIGTYINGVKQD